jgi:glycosyltransferase involved in cell wall biosynthesis
VIKKLTILITCFNHSKYVGRCLKTILNQSIISKYYDVLIIDDCSTDNSFEEINKFKSFTNLKIIQNKKNLGLVKSCIKLFRKVKTKYFVRVDSDDYVSKDFVKCFLNEMHKDYDFIYSNYKIFKKNSLLKKNVNISKFEKFISCSVAIKKNIVKKIGFYKNFYWEEYDFYLRYLDKINSSKHIKKYIYFYRYHEKNMTKKKLWREKAWKQLFKYHSKYDILKFEKLILK